MIQRWPKFNYFYRIMVSERTGPFESTPTEYSLTKSKNRSTMLTQVYCSTEQNVLVLPHVWPVQCGNNVWSIVAVNAALVCPMRNHLSIYWSHFECCVLAFKLAHSCSCVHLPFVVVAPRSIPFAIDLNIPNGLYVMYVLFPWLCASTACIAIRKYCAASSHRPNIIWRNGLLVLLCFCSCHHGSRITSARTFCVIHWGKKWLRHTNLTSNPCFLFMWH